MGSAAVESAHDFLLQSICLDGVFRLDHPLGEFTQFFRSERRVFAGLTSKLDDPVLFVPRQPFYLFNDFNRCHVLKLLVRAPMRK